MLDDRVAGAMHLYRVWSSSYILNAARRDNCKIIKRLAFNYLFV